jgi:CRISPR-associated protein Cmr1
MHRIELELTTITPAFIGTSDPANRAEWAAKSVRGHLRWWLRAVLGGELGGRADEVRAREAAIFGSNAQKSAVKIIARPFAVVGSRDPADGSPRNETELASDWGATNPAVRARLRLSRGSSNPIGYLGYGPIIYDRDKKDTVYSRARIRPGQSLRLLVQWSGAPNYLDSLQKALWCWLNLGGIGGRSRRGFGSLAFSKVIAIHGNGALFEPIQTLEQFEHELHTRLTSAVVTSPPAEWSHFTSDTRIYVSTLAFRLWEEALMAAGAWLIAFRRRYGLSSDERVAVRNRDYVWLNSPSSGGVPDRAGFGLPLPFGKGDLVAGWRDPKKGRRDSREHDETGRRASPLLIHVARFGADHHLVLTHMPARLVPNGAEIHFHGNRNVPTPEQDGIVRAFLDDLESATKKKIRRIL